MAVHDVLRKQADGSMTGLQVGQTVYQFAMFGASQPVVLRHVLVAHLLCSFFFAAKSRDILRGADGLNLVADLLRSRDDETTDYGCRIAAYFALDGPEVCAQMRELGVHRRALELVTSTNSTVQSEAVNLVYWLSQDPESKQFLIDQNVGAILSDAQVTAKDLTVAKFLSHCSNAVLPPAKSAAELGTLVEQSSLTSSIRSARQALLSGAEPSAEPPKPSVSPLRSKQVSDHDNKATQPYYAPKSGIPQEESTESVGGLSAPKANQATSNEEPLTIDQVKLTFSLAIQNRKRLKKVVIAGNIQELGMWAPKKAALMFQNARGDYEFELLLPSWRREFEYKYAVVERTEKGDNEDFVWESGFIRKCKLDNNRLQKVEDAWESEAGLEDFAPGNNDAQRSRSVTEGPAKTSASKVKDDARGRSQSGGGGWRNAYSKAGNK